MQRLACLRIAECWWGGCRIMEFNCCTYCDDRSILILALCATGLGGAMDVHTNRLFVSCAKWCRYVWYLYIACNISAAAFVAFVVPETAGKQLEN